MFSFEVFISLEERNHFKSQVGLGPRAVGLNYLMIKSFKTSPVSHFWNTILKEADNGACDVGTAEPYNNPGTERIDSAEVGGTDTHVHTG